ncbi:MAG: 30S ribosomal protein S5 [Candidatus Woesearchaeota archaeon]|nr:30S ribosomal protein S5 [Candidatus Woesearchaeota archaeon]
MPEEETAEILEKKEFIKDSWSPKTGLGRKVKNGEITDIDYILDRGMKILEPEIVDALLPNLKMDLIMVGQAKGKFGGGQRRVFKQTQKKTPEGNKPHFGAYVVVGNEDGYVGVGYGKAKETVPAREKAIRNAKLSVMKVRRGCGSWQCGCGNYHSIPFAVEGRCGSVRIKLIPAPKGKGLCVTRECQKILALAGIKDVWSKMIGQGRSTINLVNASMAALHNLTAMKTGSMASNRNKFIEGKIKGEEKPSAEINAGEGEEQ